MAENLNISSCSDSLIDYDAMLIVFLFTFAEPPEFPFSSGHLQCILFLLNRIATTALILKAHNFNRDSIQ